MPIEIKSSSPASETAPDRPLVPALLNGAARRCPACGEAPLYRAYLKVVDHCPACGTALHHQRADDAPPYFTMFIVGHIVVGGLLSVEKAFSPPTWVQLAIWLPMTLVLSLLLLPVVKGVLVALQWALRMHGFGASPDPSMPDPDPAEVLRGQTQGGRA